MTDDKGISRMSHKELENDVRTLRQQCPHKHGLLKVKDWGVEVGPQFTRLYVQMECMTKGCGHRAFSGEVL